MADDYSGTKGPVPARHSLLAKHTGTSNQGPPALLRLVRNLCGQARRPVPSQRMTCNGRVYSCAELQLRLPEQHQEWFVRG